MKALIANYGSDTVIYGHRSYRIQNDRNHLHIVVYEGGVRRKITVKMGEKTDCVFDYIFGGGFEKYPCPAMDYWIYRHRLGNRISVKDYAVKFKVLIYKV